MTLQAKQSYLLPLFMLSVVFWVLFTIGTVKLMAEVNTPLRPKRLALLASLFVTDVTPRGRMLQLWTKATGAAFIGLLTVCGLIASL